MHFDPAFALKPEELQKTLATEERIDRWVRGFDRLRSRLPGGRKRQYDDLHYQFVGGSDDLIRKKHYDKSLRLLWKAEAHLPWSSFKDCSKEEHRMLELAEPTLSQDERAHVERLGAAEYKALLNREYTPEQKQAIVNILALIGHGEAYAWMVSTSLLNSSIEGTGARAALTMQVLEEAKHFVVLKELIAAFDCPVPRMNVWEYLIMERTLKSKGLEKFFGMNVLIECFALNLFGQLSTLPGLEVLRLFHLDESRHTGLPGNYFSEHPMTAWQSRNPIARLKRLLLVAPALPLMVYIEKDFAVLGLDVYAFAGSTLRKVTNLAERSGFLLPIRAERFLEWVDHQFNRLAARKRVRHTPRDYRKSETTRGRAELEVEREIFRVEEPASAA